SLCHAFRFIGPDKISRIITERFHDRGFWIPILIAPHHFIDIVIGALGIAYAALCVLIKGIVDYFFVRWTWIDTFPSQGYGIRQVPIGDGILAAQAMGDIGISPYRDIGTYPFPNFLYRCFYPWAKNKSSKPGKLFIYLYQFIKSIEPFCCRPENLGGDPNFGIRMKFVQYLCLGIQPLEQYIGLQVSWIATGNKQVVQSRYRLEHLATFLDFHF